MNTHHNSSSFLKGVMKMAEVDIDRFDNHSKPEDCPDEPTGKTIPFTPGEVIEGGSTGNQNANKKCHSEKGKLKEPDFKKRRLKGGTECYLKNKSHSQKHSILTILNQEMETVLQRQEHILDN